jgi:hypothetical protein
MKQSESYLATILPYFRQQYFLKIKHCPTLHANMFKFTQQLTRSTLNYDTIVNILGDKIFQNYSLNASKSSLLFFPNWYFLYTQIDTCFVFVHSTYKLAKASSYVQYNIYIDESTWCLNPGI